MASVTPGRDRIRARVDSAGRLVAADEPLAELQAEAGSALGEPLALPQLAAVARLARKLGISVTRHVLAASADEDVELRVRAEPEGDEVALTIEDWTARPPRRPALGPLFGRDETETIPEILEWATDEQLRITSVSPALAALLGSQPDEAEGQPLTRLIRLEEDENGDMPLLAALAARRAFAGQPAHARAASGARLVLSGEAIVDSDGNFAGFRGDAAPAGGERSAAAAGDREPSGAVDEALDEALRSPLDRIVENADRIASRLDGPLRSDYASYAGDISAAARHLLSVIHGMSEQPGNGHDVLDLTAVAAEAVIMLEAPAKEQQVEIVLDPAGPLRARGEERGVIQILVNLIGNAVRHSPVGGTVRLHFERNAAMVSASVIDEGGGIPKADQERIFERFERAGDSGPGTGLGLAISRRLARSMGGDITLDSTPGRGARFILSLPAA